MNPLCKALDVVFGMTFGLNQWIWHPCTATMIQSFKECNPSGKVIIIILMLGSIMAWTIMVTKMIELIRADRSSRKFLLSFRKEKSPVAIFLKRYRFQESPIYRIYEVACMAIGAEVDPQGTDPEELFMNDMGERPIHLSVRQLEGVRNVAERAVADQALLLEKDMGYLATAVSTAPFLGLLGTVWGVMEAFGGMAVTGNATLSAVTPGISAALLTTVVGLLVALPSAIGYNLATNRIRTLSVQMDNFGQEYIAAIQREFLKD